MEREGGDQKRRAEEGVGTFLHLNEDCFIKCEEDLWRREEVGGERVSQKMQIDILCLQESKCEEYVESIMR